MNARRCITRSPDPPSLLQRAGPAPASTLRFSTYLAVAWPLLLSPSGRVCRWGWRYEAPDYRWGCDGRGTDRLCRGQDGRALGAGRISGEFLVLLLLGVGLYLAFSGVVALVARRSPRTGQSFDLVAGRALPRATHAHSARHRRRSAESGESPDGTVPRDAPTGEPDRRLPAR